MAQVGISTEHLKLHSYDYWKPQVGSRIFQWQNGSFLPTLSNQILFLWDTGPRETV